MFVFFSRFIIVLLMILGMFYSCAWLTSGNGSQPGAEEVGYEQEPIRAVTIEDVLAAKIPKPTIDRVSFPRFSYRDAFPDSTDEPLVTIKSFQQAPMLENMDSMDELVGRKIREHYPPTLPPVAERLPVNPAVMRGPDGVGQYGGVWHRVRSNNFAWNRRIMYETLIRHDPSGQHQAGVAYRWEVSDNNRVFTFYLRPGHKWSDGVPFTAHDIVYQCNTVVGSPWRRNPPNWMQATDGANQIYLEDFSDWRALAKRIVKQLQTEGSNPGKQLFVKPGSYIEPQTVSALIDLEDFRKRYEQTVGRVVKAQGKLLKALQQLADETEGGPVDEATGFKLLDLFSVVLKNRDYFDLDAWEDVDLTSELRRLEGIGASRLTQKEMERYLLLLERADMAKRIVDIRLSADTRGTLSKANILFFRAAYSDLVKPAARDRVKVEAVADEKGNDDHILRFTFKKPSSFFLEKTTTFMFYFGMFHFHHHINRQLFPHGTPYLTLVDFCDWEKFVELLRADGGDVTKPAGRVWSMLDEDLRQRIVDEPLNNDSDEEYKQAVIDGINRLFVRKDFYDGDVWGAVDFEAEQREMLVDGYLKAIKEVSNVNRIPQLLKRADWLKRVEAEGVDTLGEQELFDFNVAMFRVIFNKRIDANGDYDSDGPYTVVAINRDMALNHDSQTGEKTYESWVRKRYLKSSFYHPEYNRDIPTLMAWKVVSARADIKQIAVRNPYYYRVDVEGNQLPYIDAIENAQEPDREARILKLKAGVIDMQDTEIRLQDYTVLKQSEEKGNYQVRLWARDRCGLVALSVNQNHVDPDYKRILGDKRFRQALSLALNRQEIIDVVYSGLGRPTQFSIPRGSPYYSEKLDNVFVAYDVDRANALLDEMGLQKRGREGTRMYQDENGKYRPLQLVASTDEARVPVNVAVMACEYWRAVGIGAQMKLQRNINRLADTGVLDVAIHEGGGSFFGPLLAGGFAPTHPAECWQWNAWVAYLRSGGIQGMEPPDHIKELDRMWLKVSVAPSEEAKHAAWQALMDRSADYLPVIGIMEPPGELMYVSNRMKNVPQFALAGWIPHGPGNVCPEVFYLVGE